MADFFGALLIGTGAAGALYVWDQARKQSATPEPVYMPVSQPARGRSGFDPSGLLDWGLNTIFGTGTGSSTGQPATTGGPTPGGGFDFGGLVTDIFGGTGTGTGQGGGTSARPILDLIGRAEAPAGYNTVYYGSKIQPPQPITTMTVGAVLDWQSRSVSSGSASSAAGRYQIIRNTLSGLVSRGVLSRSELFDAAAQDRAAEALMGDAGWIRYKAGQIDAESFAQGLSRIWAGLPAFDKDKRGRKATGQSYYAGDGLNAATVSQSQVLSALSASKGAWA